MSPYRPAAHGRHDAAETYDQFPVLYEPAGHAIGGTPATQKKPAGHAVVQLPVVPLPAVDVPFGHA